jgi:hypothetical protein
LNDSKQPAAHLLTFSPQIRFATNYFFDTGIYFPKFSIITFYANLVPVTHPEMRTALYVLAAITTSFALATFFGDTFWCGPDPSINWSVITEKHDSTTNVVLTGIFGF